MNDITYDVRVYKTEVYEGKTVTTYYVRWQAGKKRWREPFRHSAQAESFRSKLLSAAKDGEAFSITTGQPVSWERDKSRKPAKKPIDWYALTLDYAAAKWKYAYRRSPVVTRRNPAGASDMGV